jgi:PAS domain S-box-containing protein
VNWMLRHAHPELQGAGYVVFADSSRHYVDCSDSVCHLLGYSRDEMLQKTIDDVSHNPNETSTLFAQLLKTGRDQGEYVLKRMDGTPVLIRYRAFAFDDGCKAAVWEPIHDWRELYLAALVEFKPAKLKQKIEIALAAIERARHSQSAHSQTIEEQKASDAISALNALLRNIG